MFWVEDQRDVVQLGGSDVGSYLQSQVSQDVARLDVGASAWTLLLEPGGRVESLARVWRTAEDEFVLDTDAGFGEVLAARLNRFRIRVKAEVVPLTWRCLAVRPAPGSPGVDVPDGAVVAWGGGYDLIGVAPQPPSGVAAGSTAELLDARVAACWPAMGAEIVPGRTIPAETGLVTVAVSFTKGCYPGQELVERMDSRAAEAPRHLEVFERLPGDESGAPLVRDGREIGVVTSVGTSQVLALVRRAATPCAA